MKITPQELSDLLEVMSDPNEQDSMKPRIFADFNKVYGPPEKRCAILTCIGTVNDLKQQGIQFAEGMEVTLYQPDGNDANGNPDLLEVDAVIEFNDRGEWIGVFAFDELDYRSERRRQRV